MLKRCDALIMTDNWLDSSGARAEHDLAIKEGIPVFYSLNELRGALGRGDIVQRCLAQDAQK